MSLAIRKLSFVQEFLKLEDEVVIEDFEKLLALEKIKMYQGGLKPMTIDELESELKLSMQDSLNDNVFSNDELLKNIADW
jgi:hypothetical protein